MAADMRVVKTEESHEYAHVLLIVGLLTEVLVNGVHAVQEGLYILEAIVEGERKYADC